MSLRSEANSLSFSAAIASVKDSDDEELGIESTMRAESPNLPDIVRAKWKPDDHIAELSSILQGVAAVHAEKQLVNYVQTIIEPAGWKAVWTIPPNQTDAVFTLKHGVCVFADVVDVSQEKLVAMVKVLKPVFDNLLLEDLQIIEEGKNKIVEVPLMELSVLADQENGALDMVSTAEVICQIKFFYEHVWQPWDLEEDVCYNESLITSRLKLYQDMESGRIPTAVSASLRAILREGNIALKKIQHIETKNEETSEEFEMDQEDVAQLFMLHKHLERLKAQFELLKDPVLREISVIPSQVEETSTELPHAKVKLVGHTLTTTQMMKHLTLLPEVVASLSQVPDEVLWQTHSTLQTAINGAHEGDVIILLPGQHTLTLLGYSFAQAGALIGVGEDVVVKGNDEGGDVLMDVTGNFTIQNITLKPAPHQIGIVQHNGTITLDKVTIKGGRWGFLGLGNTQFSVSQVSIQECTEGGMDFRDGSVVNISTSSIKRCKIGIQMEEGVKITLSNTRIENNIKYGVLKILNEDQICSMYENLRNELLSCLLKEENGNAIEHNGQDDVAVSGSIKK